MNSFGGSRSFEEEREFRTKTIRDDITKRLRRACSNLSEEEFFKLVEQMTREQMRGEGRHS